MDGGLYAGQLQAKRDGKGQRNCSAHTQVSAPLPWKKKKKRSFFLMERNNH